MKTVTQVTYDQAALEAKTASEQADKLNTIQTHRIAAACHYAARIQAWGLGDEKTFKSHDESAGRHLHAVHQLADGKKPIAAKKSVAAGDKIVHNGKDLEVTQQHIDQGGEAAKTPLEAASWVEDEDTWEKAKTAADKSYDKSDDAYWPVVATIYENMGGTVKSKNARQTSALQASANKRMAAKTELKASIKDGGYSFTDLQANLRDECLEIDQLNTPPTGQPMGCGCWITDIIAPSHEAGELWEAIVQGADGKLYCVNFKMGDNNSVTIEGAPKEVERTTDYDYVFEPETPETVVAKKAYHDSKALEAGAPFGNQNAAKHGGAEKITEPGQRIGTVAYRIVHGNAKGYNYTGGKVYESYEGEDGQLKARPVYETGPDRRSDRLAEQDAINHANEKGIPFEHGIRQGYVFNPHYSDQKAAKLNEAREKVYNEGKNSKPSSALEASRAEDKLKKNYTEAAVEAHDATDGIKDEHEVAGEKHRIAASHAKIAGLPIHAAMHAARAASHDAEVKSLEAGDAAGHRLAASAHKTAQTQLTAAHSQMKDNEELKAKAGPMECAATHHGLMASAHEAHAASCSAGSATPSAALEAGGPGSGPRPNANNASRDAYSKTNEASAKTQTARASDSKEKAQAAADAHSSAALAHEHAANLHDEAGNKGAGNIHREEADRHTEMARIYNSKAMMLSK